MRITAVDMYASTLEEAISFSLESSGEKSQYTVRTILGLDADDIISKFYGRGLNGSLKFYDFGMKPRDIALRVVLTPRFDLGKSYSDVRDHLYRAISANRTGLVTLYLKAGGSEVAQIQGSITKFEATHFTQLPEVQITIRCNDPMFKAINQVSYEPGVLVEANPIVIPDNLSTAPHGFTMKFTMTAAIASFTIQDVAGSPEWKYKIIPVGGFLIGDAVYFSSENSNKYIYLVRGGSTIQLANSIEPTSIWPILFPGTNSFYFNDIASMDFNYVRFYAAYWGV